MNSTDDTLRDLKRALEARRDTALAQGNAKLASKWIRELHQLANPIVAAKLNELGVEPSALGTLAIYAMQKVRRLLNGKPDPYTVTLIGNARAIGSGQLTGRVARDVLSGVSSVGIARAGGLSTASTQVSSSRAALAALRIVKVTKGKEGKGLAFDLEHSLIKEVA